MKTTFRFKTRRFRPTSDELDEAHEDYINPDVFGRELADFLRSGLQSHGYEINSRCAEDWGYWQEIQHSGDYILAIGCSNLDESDSDLTEHLVFIEPNKPVVRPLRRLFRKTNVRDDVEALVLAVGQVLRSDDQIRDIQLEDA